MPVMHNLIIHSTPTANGRPTTYSPLPWHPYFSQEFYLTSPTTPLTHHVYFTAPSKPSAPLFVLQHGAGSSALSFAACCAEIRKLAPEVGLLAPEARGHGETTIKPEFVDKETENGVLNMELDRLGTDLEAAIELTKDKMGWTDLPNIIMIGHSLGGAIVTHVAKGGRLGVKLLAFAVLDVVEGILSQMPIKLYRIVLMVLRRLCYGRPKEHAILFSIETEELPNRRIRYRVAVCHLLYYLTPGSSSAYSVRSRTVRGLLSARISVPSILFPPLTTSNTSTSPETAFVIDDTTPPSTAPTNNMSIPENSTPPFNPVTTTPPANNFPSHPQTLPLPPPSGVWTWRTDLSTTSDYWENWFGGMSSKFLSSRGGKLLLLAGTDRLDKELMIGQMQGTIATIMIKCESNYYDRQIPAPSLSRSWALHSGRPTGEDCNGPCGLLEAERRQAGIAAESECDDGSEACRVGDERCECNNGAYRRTFWSMDRFKISNHDLVFPLGS